MRGPGSVGSGPPSDSTGCTTGISVSTADQVREWARLDNSGSPDRKGIRTAHPGNTPAPFTPTADPGPSVHNRKARGGGPRQEVNVDTGAKTANKADDQGLDVEKTVAALRELVAKLEA